MIPTRRPSPASSFFGPTVVRAAFVMALFGWGVGFYGPPVFLVAVMARTGWSEGAVAFAQTLHFIAGASAIPLLPRLHRRIGLSASVVLASALAAIGTIGWAVARRPEALALAAVASGAGWVGIGAVALNAAIAPWYERDRPRALGRAYNGASLAGAVFTPLWAALIDWTGFVEASVLVASVMVATVSWLAFTVFRYAPASLGQQADGLASRDPTGFAAHDDGRPLVRGLWRDRRAITLAAAMALALFAQIGLLAHLFALLVPTFGARPASLCLGLATACAIAGRSVVARRLARGADRRRLVATGYAVQLVGTALLAAAFGTSSVGIVAGLLLIGCGIGNATSLPPLVVQDEFRRDDVARVVARIVAVAQATYAFAPAAFGALLASAGPTAFFALAVLAQLAAIASVLAGGRRRAA